MLKGKENMGNGGYIKITTTTNRGQKTILRSESMDDVELEKEKLKHQDLSNLTKLSQKLSACGLKNDVVCSFILFNKIILVYYY